MNVWLLKDGEMLPFDGKDVRLLRMGLIANELVKRGHKVVWWTSSFNNFKKEFRCNCDKDISVVSNYLIKMLHGPGYKSNISFKRIFHNRVIAKKFLQIAEEEKSPDIILSSLPTIELANAATQYGEKHDIPVLLDLRDMWPDIMVEVMPRFLRPFARIALEWQFRAIREACQNATGLIGITSGFLRWGLGYAGRDQCQYDAVYPLAYSDIKTDGKCAIDAELFLEKKGLKLRDDDFVISFVGSINRSFQFDMLIKAVKKMDGVVLVIAGLGPKLEKYQYQAKDFANIIFPGWLSKSQILSLLKLSDIAIAPYILRKDFLMSIPNKIAEYLCVGVPILTSLSGVVGSLLEQNHCGFVYKNPEDLVMILSKLKNDQCLLKKMSRYARTLYEREFVAEKIYSDMVDHLEKIARSV